MNNPRLNPVASATVGFATSFLAAWLCLGDNRTYAQPANDLFAKRTVLTGTNLLLNTSNLGAGKEAGEPAHAGKTGGTSIWWSWTAPYDGTLSLSTQGSRFDTVLAVYQGFSVGSLTPIAANDDAPGTNTSSVVIDVFGGETYQIAVDGYNGAVGDLRLQLALNVWMAPAWTAPDVNGVPVSSSAFAGKVVLLNFWATWCMPCKAELPDLVALQSKYRADGLVIVGADLGENAPTVRDFISRKQLNYQVVLADNTMTAAYGGVTSIPQTFFIDRQNQLRKWCSGTLSRQAAENAILPLLYRNTRLACRRNGSHLVLTWPATAVAFNLESATDLANPTWTPWPTAPAVVNGTNTVTVSLSGPPLFFRLRMPF